MLLRMPALNPPAIFDCDPTTGCTGLRIVTAELADARAKLSSIDDRQRVHGEKLAGLEARIAAWSAFGALIGGGAVTILSKILR